MIYNPNFSIRNTSQSQRIRCISKLTQAYQSNIITKNELVEVIDQWYDEIKINKHK